MASGLTNYGRAAALSAIIPNGTARYVALLTTLPNSLGAGAIEATGSSYARKSHSSWLTSNVGSTAVTKNNGAIEFVALTGALSGVVGWGIYDASTAGNLIAFGELKNSGGTIITKDFVTTDQPRFVDQAIVVTAE